jgi:hypothetical protein
MMEREFKVGEVFSVVNVNRFTYKGKAYVPDSEIVSPDGDVPYIAAVSTNNGITGYSTIAPNNNGGCITLSTTADSSNTVFYQDDPFIGRQQIAELRRLDGVRLSRNVGLYVVSQVRKLTKQFNYANKLTKEQLRDSILSLPVVPSSDPLHEYTPADIDWAYMESYIAELEEERIAELDAYLKVTGLDDCELTAEDEAALAEQPVFAEFKVGEVFECEKGDVDLQQRDINRKGELFINSGLENKGIKGRTDRPAKVFPAGTLTIDFWGNAFYRDEPYKLATHNHVFSLSGDVLRNEAAGLYIEASLAHLPQLFSYTNMATWPKLRELSISLPVVPSTDPDHSYTPDDIDWAYMERCIRAIEKQVVAGMVEYKDKVIETTRGLVAAGGAPSRAGIAARASEPSSIEDSE